MNERKTADERTDATTWVNLSEIDDPEPTPVGYRINCPECGDLDRRFEDAIPAIDAAANHFARQGPGHDAELQHIYAEADDAGC